MSFESLLRRPATVAVATAALTLLAAYCLAVVDAGYALQPAQLGEAFARGSFLGVPPAWFAARMGLFAIFSAALSVLAVGGDPRSFGAYSSTALRRALVVQAPLLLTPWALAQDELGRRPSFVACFVGLSVALAIRMRPSPEAPDSSHETPSQKGIREHWPILAVMALHGVIFTWQTIERDRALWSATIDLGIFKEALWHTLHGRVMFSPTVGYSFFGEHFTPILFLLAPLYALWPTSACLLSVQALAVTASAWLLYRLSREVGLSRALATALAAAMIFSPPMHTALHYDFHMDLLAVPCLSWLVLALHRRQWLWSYVALALLVSVKEDMFIPASAAILARVFTGDRSDAKRLIPAGLVATAYCFLAMFVLIRAFGPPPGAPVYMGGTNTGHGGYKFLRNFRHLAGMGGPVRMLLGQPVRFALYAFTDARLTTLLSLLMPLSFLPLMARRRVILMAPLGIILLSDNPEIVSLRYHYSAIQHPGVFFAAAFGAAVWVTESERPQRAMQALTGMVIASAVVLLGMHPASVWARTHGTDRHAVTAHTAAVDRLVARVNANETMSATTFVGPRLSNRPWINVFPHGVQAVDAALVDLQRPAWPLEPSTRDETIRALFRQGWAAVAWEDGALLMRRHGDASRNREALRDLFARRRYEVEGTEWTEFPNCAERDAEASDGWARVVRASDPRGAGFVVFGPYVRLFPARYRVTFRLRAEPSISRDEPIGTIDVMIKGGVVIATRELEAETFPDGRWRDVTIDFAVDLSGADDVEFRVRSAKRWLLGADYVSLSSPDEEALLNTMTVR